MTNTAGMLLLVFLTSLCAGCYGFRHTMGLSWHGDSTFAPRPYESYAIEPVEKVRTRLHGFNLFGFPLRGIDVEGLTQGYLGSERRYITNLQVTPGSYTLLLIDYLFTVPFAEVSFDVIEVSER